MTSSTNMNAREQKHRTKNGPWAEWKPMTAVSCSSVMSAERILTSVQAPKENSSVVCAKMERKLSSGRRKGRAVAVATRQRTEMPGFR